MIGSFERWEVANLLAESGIRGLMIGSFERREVANLLAGSQIRGRCCAPVCYLLGLDGPVHPVGTMSGCGGELHEEDLAVA